MKNHEVPFKNAIKDENGYATILVRFNENYIPVKGKPLPLVKEEVPELDEIKRINLTRWLLKDIPEITELVGEICGDGHTTMLYWNGNEGAWKFWDDYLNGFDEDELDDILEKLENKIDELEDVLYKPHVDDLGNMGDESVHCIYLGNSDVKLWDNTDEDKHGIKKYIVTAVDYGDTSDCKARILAVCKNKDEAKAYVHDDIKAWADEQANMPIVVDFDKMSAKYEWKTLDDNANNGCEWNIEEVEIPE